MKNKDTNSISFIFNEMDPSEEVEFERELRASNNLLIDVESLKNTKKQLDRLPQINPPEHISNSIRLLAAKKAASSKRRKQFTVYSAVAAVLVAGFMSGIYFYDSPEPNQTADQAIMGGGNNLQQLVVPAPSAGKDLTPWVDQNEVLRFTDQFQPGENATFDTVFRNSFQKLTPVTDPVQSRAYQRNLQLTGSNQ
ncbi:MAG: hypothetical protein WEA56_11870 [Balneolaceae bacterium]